MCLVAMAIEPGPHFMSAVASNRDKFLDRLPRPPSSTHDL
jgi:uncharacterized protein with NRDE domain